MLSIAKVSTRGQVAVPKAIREKLSIKDGDTLLFEEKDGKVYIRKVRNFLDLEGTIPTLKLQIEKMREEAMEEMAREVEGV
ncbi:MAG: AbrB/MazE/SpoVT family DNA-binding domain-containing protein [Nitrospirae bacterium]|nr:AbrB/MazE/SpoVT family DNA-binding domain-containing protein [Nitrospirota bacterium]